MSDDQISEENKEEIIPAADKTHSLLSTLFLYTVTFFFFMLPIKFGSIFIAGTINSFPSSFIYDRWPGYILTIFVSVLVIISILIFRPSRMSKYNTKITLSWLFIGICTVAFGYYQYNQLYYFYSINQIVIAVLSCLLVAICLDGNPRSRKFILGGICGGLLYSILNGLHQYLWGFASNIDFLDQQKALGIAFNPAHESRIRQKLVFSSFTISNSFAAHIILTLPVTVYIILKKLNKEHFIACRVFGTTLLIFAFTTFMSSENLLLTFVTMALGMFLCFGLDHINDKGFKSIAYLLVLLCLVVLAMTRSRAGILCFIAGLAFAGAICSKGKVRIGCIAVLAIGLIVGAIFARKVGSFQVRLGYYGALIEMMKEQPMGYGFGGFSEFYNRTKGPGIEESNSPHSFFFGYLGHGGIIAGLSVLLCFIVSIVAITRQKIENSFKFCLIAGFSSWFFHSQLDFNIMIPGTVAIAATILMLAVGKREEENPPKTFSPLFTALIPIVITIAYFAVQHSYYQSKYTDFHAKLIDVELKDEEGKVIQELPPIDVVQNEMNKLADDMPFSTAHYEKAANWAMLQSSKLEGRDEILSEAYLSLAEEALLKAIEINPKKSSFNTNLAKIYFERKNFNKAKEALDRAFQLYPYNSHALKLEGIIFNEWYKREPLNTSLITSLLQNKVKNLEVSLGHMMFQDHLLISQKQIESMYRDLDKRVSELYTEIDFIVKSGLKVETAAILKQINDIHLKAQKLAQVDR